jgi:hypothetical protein
MPRPLSVPGIQGVQETIHLRPREHEVGFPIYLLVFLIAGWFGARLIGLGIAVIKRRTMEVGFGYHLRGRSAVSVGTVVLLAGLLAITPFVWGIGRLLIDVIDR